MKKQKQNKIKPTACVQFLPAAQAAALETARRVAAKLGCEYAVITKLDEAADNAVSIYQRNELLYGRKTRWSSDVKKTTHVVIDVLINPAKVPAALKAQAAYELVLPTIEKAKAVAPELYNPYWNSLVRLVKDSHAVSCVFRASVEFDAALQAVDFVASSYRRNDRIGELNAVRYGSRTGVERLLVQDLDQPPANKNSGRIEKWAGVVNGYDEINVERIVESAVELCEPYCCVSVETVDDLYKHLSDSQIWEGAAEAQELAARKAYVRKLAGDLDAMGLMVIKGISEWIDNKLVYSIAVTVKDDRFKHEVAGDMDMIQRKESLEALHKALVK